MSKIIVGNKCDCKEKERQVSFSEASKFASSYGIELVETSAKENINVRVRHLRPDFNAALNDHFIPLKINRG